MMRSKREGVLYAVACGFLLLVSGCLFDEAGGSQSPATEGARPDGTDEGHDTPECATEFEACVLAISEEGEDPSVCRPILDGCGEPDHEGPAEESCWEEFDTCICDPAGEENPERCEDALDACLGDVDPRVEDLDPCAAAFDACMEETCDPEACAPILEECEVPPEEPCVEEFGVCMADSGDHDACEPMLIDCFEPPPEEPDDVCIERYESCAWTAEDPDVCEPILDECHDLPEEEEPPFDEPCVEDYERCIEWALESDDPEEARFCEEILLCCYVPEGEDARPGEEPGYDEPRPSEEPEREEPRPDEPSMSSAR